jgi:hypothetical protein
MVHLSVQLSDDKLQKILDRQNFAELDMKIHITKQNYRF